MNPKANPPHYPIQLYDGKILDGRNRYAAYNQIKPKKEPEFLPEEDSDPQTIEITSEEIILSFVSNIESLFLDEL